MNILFTNNAKTLLDGAILIDATSIVVDDGSDFPSPTGSQFFYATLQNPADDTDYEIVKCTARSGNTLTVTREQDGTSAQAWTDGTLCELRFTAGGIDELKAHAADHLSGGSAEVDGDKLDIDFNPSNYTPATTPSEVDSIDNLAAHLYGLDQRVAAASQDARGTIELATHPEAQAGTATGLAVTPSALTAVLKQQSWMQGDGYYIGTDKVRARDEDGLNLEDDGGLGIHIADGGAVLFDADITTDKVQARDGDGLDLEDDGGLGIHIADGGAVLFDADITTDKVQARDGDGLDLEDDGGLGIHIADGGAVLFDADITTDKVQARDGDGLDLEDDGGLGIHIADGGAVLFDADITTDKVQARDGDGLDLEDDGGLGIHIADGGAVLFDADITVPGLTLTKTFTPFQGADVASANDMTLGDGNFFDITGTTTINTIATKGVGTFVVLQFDGILQLTHSADLVLPTAANITTAAGDIAVFYEYATGDWRCMAYTRADGTPVASLTPTDSNFIVGNGSTWVAESGDTARTSLGLGSGDSPGFAGLTLTKTFTPFQGADVASANDMTLGDGNFFDITGTTTINTIATKGVGTFVVLQFDGILQLTHSADLVLPTAANITTAAGDIAVFYEYAAGDWRCMAYTRADGTPLVGGGDSSMSEASVADDAQVALDTGKTGWGFAMAGDNEQWIQFSFTAAGVVTVIANSALAVNTDTDGNLCVYDAGAGIAIKNRLGATKTIRYTVNYS